MKKAWLRFINRKVLILSLLLLVTLSGFGAKFYSGPLQELMNNSIAGFFYEIFWCLVIYLFFGERISPFRIAMIVLLFTSFLEVLQLWHPPFLEWFRSYFLGRVLIGTTFSCFDFLFYVAGVTAGGLLLRLIENHQG